MFEIIHFLYFANDIVWVDILHYLILILSPLKCRVSVLNVKLTVEVCLLFITRFELDICNIGLAVELRT